MKENYRVTILKKDADKPLIFKEIESWDTIQSIFNHYGGVKTFEDFKIEQFGWILKIEDNQIDISQDFLDVILLSDSLKIFNTKEELKQYLYENNCKLSETTSSILA